MEVEFKFLVPKDIKWEDVIGNEQIKKYILSDSEKLLSMKAYYFDTSDHKLSKAGLSFRVRYENDELVCTTKYGGGSSNNGLHEREEINVIVNEEFLKSPSIDVFKDYDVYIKFKDTIKCDEILPLIRMDYIRKECTVNFKETVFVMSLDEGEIVTPFNKEKIYELEIELSSGNVEKLTEFGEILKNELKLSPFTKSKLERGMRNLEKK